MKKAFITLLAGMALMMACRKDPVTVDPPPPADTTDTSAARLTPYDLKAPAFFPAMIIPDDNKPYVERIALGRRLYYDPIISNDGRFCAGCHIQSKGFTSDHISVDGLTVMPHVNLAWTTNWLWYGGEQGPMEKVMFFEVHDFFKIDTSRINADTMYRRLFKEAYGVSQISTKNITYALAQFIRTLISNNSKYYRNLTGQVALTPDEEQGKNIFFSERGDCFHCHSNPLLTDNDFHNTGLDSPFVRTVDKGRFNVTGNPNDMGKFRTANLHNVALRKHFMHDGRFTTLEQVVEFYNSGVKRTATLDPIMTKPGKENGLKLTPLEKYQLVQFLKTLTDSTYITNPAFSRP